MFKEKEKILITGCAGFIGSNFVQNLLNENIEIVGLDNINDYYSQDLKYSRLKTIGINIYEYNKLIPSKTYSNFKFIKLDIEDKTNLEELFFNEGFTVICNFAAQAGVRYSIKNPDTFISSNITGFINLLELSKEYNIKNFLYASSSSIYGNTENDIFDVDDDTSKPTNVYAATKKSNELFAHVYSHIYGIKTTGLRFFTVYGPGARPDMALHTFVKSAYEKQAVNIYNNGEMFRDFTYIDDVIELIKRALMANLNHQDLYKIYNIGNSSPIKLLDFVNVIEKHLGFEVEKNYLPLQDGDMLKTYSNMKETINELKYQPNTSIDEGVKNFISWYKEYYKVGKNENFLD